MTPAAEGLLTDLDYTHGDTVSWDILGALCEVGHAYTNQSGRDVPSQTDDMNSSSDSTTLNKKEGRRLEEFLSRRTQVKDPKRDLLESLDEDHNNNLDLDEIIGGQTKGFIECWSPSEEAYQTTWTE